MCLRCNVEIYRWCDDHDTIDDAINVLSLFAINKTPTRSTRHTTTDNKLVCITDKGWSDGDVIHYRLLITILKTGVIAKVTSITQSNWFSLSWTSNWLRRYEWFNNQYLSDKSKSPLTQDSRKHSLLGSYFFVIFNTTKWKIYKTY